MSSGYLLHVREDNLYAAPFDPREKRAGPSFLVLGGLRTNALLGVGHYDVSETGPGWDREACRATIGTVRAAKRTHRSAFGGE